MKRISLFLILTFNYLQIVVNSVDNRNKSCKAIINIIHSILVENLNNVVIIRQIDQNNKTTREIQNISISLDSDYNNRNELKQIHNQMAHININDNQVSSLIFTNLNGDELYSGMTGNCFFSISILDKNGVYENYTYNSSLLLTNKNELTATTTTDILDETEFVIQNNESVQFSKLKAMQSKTKHLLNSLYVSLGILVLVVLGAIFFTVYRYKTRIISESMYEFKNDSFQESGSYRLV
jgi:hypothetical protein